MRVHPETTLRVPTRDDATRTTSETPNTVTAPKPAQVDGFQAQNAVRTTAPVALEVASKPLVGTQQPLFGWGKDSRDHLIEDTKDFRKQLGNLRALKTELDGMSKSDPRYGEVQQALAAAEKSFSGKWGYTADKLPKPGTLWVDPKFMSKELPGDQVTASHFPVGTPVTRPPTPESVLFGSGRPYQMTDPGGNSLAPGFTNLASYESSVAQYREQQGMPVKDGRPIGVQVNFEGGGGKGKRYASALQEMARLGVVPTSVAGTSAGSIAAAIVAAGADPAELQRFVTDPALGKLLDAHIPDGGLADGQNAFDLFDQELRKLTGITDRPVTFADLKMPLQLVASKMSDSQASGDLTDPKNRVFVFSQETTPDTPVALAVRASMAIPGVFEPVQMVDPTDGRLVKLVDGGVLDNLPMRESPDFNLPTVGVGLVERDSLNPNVKRDEPGKVRGGNLNVGNVFLNGFYGLEMAKAAHSGTDDYHDLVDPKAGQFMLGIPTWDLTDPSKGDKTLDFGYDAKVDPALDAQTRAVTNKFFQSILGQLTDPTAKGSNIPKSLPKDFSFEVPVHVKGADYTASYSGGDTVHFTGKDGKTFDAKLGREKIESIYVDELSFGGGGLAAELAFAVDHPWQDKLGDKLPF